MARETRRYTRAPITITPFGIHCDEYYPVQEEHKSGPLIVGTIKTLESAYGVEYLIKAFAELTRRLPNIPVRLEIAGDGILRRSLELLAQTEGIARRVTFLGRIPQRNVPQMLRRLDIYAALSLRESFGVAVLEASASGIPVVTTNVDGLPEVVAHGVTGYLVPPRDPKAAADALVLLCLDGALRKSLGIAGRAFVLERYEWIRTAKIMEALYDSALRLESPREPVYI
jgi:glycosyltransferase involved in cell wall biosynthesis